MADWPTRIVQPQVLRDYMERLLAAAGCSPDSVASVAAMFLEADLRGMGVQGLDHMTTLLEGLRNGSVNGEGQPRTVKEGTGTALVDGGGGPGPLAGVLAADLAAEKARATGCAAVGVRNSQDIYLLGYYADRMARSGLSGSSSPRRRRGFTRTERSSVCSAPTHWPSRSPPERRIRSFSTWPPAPSPRRAYARRCITRKCFLSVRPKSY